MHWLDAMLFLYSWSVCKLFGLKVNRIHSKPEIEPIIGGSAEGWQMVSNGDEWLFSVPIVQNRNDVKVASTQNNIASNSQCYTPLISLLTSIWIKSNDNIKLHHVRRSVCVTVVIIIIIFNWSGIERSMVIFMTLKGNWLTDKKHPLKQSITCAASQNLFVAIGSICNCKQSKPIQWPWSVQIHRALSKSTNAEINISYVKSNKLRTLLFKCPRRGAWQFAKLSSSMKQQ